MRLAGRFIGLFIAALGALGIAAPGMFLGAVGFFQTTPAIFLAAVIRVLVGFVLFRAAPDARARKTLRVIGVVIIVGGLLTPLIGLSGGRAILEWWAAQGAWLIRLWGGVAAALGVFLVYSLAPPRRAV